MTTAAPSSTVQDIKPRRGRRQNEKNKQNQKQQQKREKQYKDRKLLLLLSLSLPVTQSPALDEYISVLPSPESRIKIPQRLNQVFKAQDIPGSSIEERAEVFAKKARGSPQWLDTSMRSLVADFKKRVEVEKDLRGITAKHYFSAIKNFCLIDNMGTTTVNWLLLSKKFHLQPLKQMSEAPPQKRCVCFSSMQIDG